MSRPWKSSRPRRRDVLALGALVPALAACHGRGPVTQGGGTCPGPSTVSGGSGVASGPVPVDVEAWRSGAHEAWFTVTGLSVPGGVLDADYLAFFPGTIWWEPSASDPWIAVQGGATTVVAVGDELVGLGTDEGTEMWRTTLVPPAQGLVVAGVLDGLLWTSAGAVDSADGTVEDVPEPLALADDAMVTGTMLVTARSTGSDTAPSCQVTCLHAGTCAVRWTTDLEVPASVSQIGDQVLVGGHRLLNRGTGRDEGEILIDYAPPVDNAGAFEVVHDPQEGLGLVVQDDGAQVVLSCYEGLTGSLSLKHQSYQYPWPESLDDATLVWSLPLDLAPGAVVAAAARGRDPVQEPDSDAFWTIDLTDDGSVRLARWEPHPA